MKQHNLDEEFIARFRNTDFSSESINKEKNREILKSKLTTLNEERDAAMKKRFKKPIAVAACVAVALTLSVTVFGHELVRYVRTTMLGDHAGFVVAEITGDEERQADINVSRNEVDVSEWVEPDWLTFTDAEEGRSHFITNALLPGDLPNGFEFKHIFYFVESMDELQEYGANKYMGVIFSDGYNELRMQIRFMDETTGFYLSATENMQTIDINGHEAIIDTNTISLLIGDVLYLFFGNEKIGTEELLNMAQSLY